jgi:tetratricopeptide (TPR) repeat protein
MQLQIAHKGFDAEQRALFEVIRQSDGKHGGEAALESPTQIQIAPNRTLMTELRWYLEEYLTVPYGAYVNQAKQIEERLERWGRECFDALFGTGHARDWFSDARKAGLEKLQLKIASDDPAVLAWPWEALCGEDDGSLAHCCCIERQLSEIGEAPALSKGLSVDHINILMVIARPYGDSDVDYCTLARPLIEYVKGKKLPVHIDLLRPPTFDQLRALLHEKESHYHIVHFDGHGGFGNFTADARSAPEGVLLFEKEEGEPDLIEASRLGDELKKYHIPIMVLNACQSATVDEHAQNPFSSVATSLLKAGIRSVVAMSYSLYVSGAQQFVPAFYDRLFESGDVAEALRAGRQKMFACPDRNSAIGKYPLRDWMVPVLYQQAMPGKVIIPKLESGVAPKDVEDTDVENLTQSYLQSPADFIGREQAVLSLERALRRRPAAILIHGMAGVGKTTLAKGFLQWLHDTNGQGLGTFWFSFEDIRSSEAVIDTLVGEILGTQAMALPMDKKLPLLTQVLREYPFILLWDNFESASGIPGTEVSALLREEDREQLKELLNALYGGKTKVLITSRQKEDWLSSQECYRLPGLEGLQGEELWQYCTAIVEDLKLKLDRSSTDFLALMDKLAGNPLAIKAVLSRLNQQSLKILIDDFDEQFANLTGDEATRRIQAALSVVEKGLDIRFNPILRFLGLCEHYAHVDMLEYMLKTLDDDISPSHLPDLFAILGNAGLCTPVATNIFQLHPALRSCLSRLHPADEPYQHAFVVVMGAYADYLTGRELHEQRAPFTVHGANFHRAMVLAQALGISIDAIVIMHSLAAYAQNAHNFSEASRLSEELVLMSKRYNFTKGEAAAYYLKGIIAQEQWDLASAQEWYERSLAIRVKQGDEHEMAQTYHQLGTIAQEQWDLASAQEWYERSLAINEKQGDEHEMALTYNQLGRIAQEQWDFASAQEWYERSLAINEKQGDEYGVALTANQLGIIAQRQHDFDQAQGWYERSLVIAKKLRDEHVIALAYHQLGTIALEREDYAKAQAYCERSLAIKTKQGDEHGMAQTYHQLGMIAQEQWDFASAQEWYERSLAINEKQGDEHGMALTANQLGRIAELQRAFALARSWYEKSLAIFERENDSHNADIVQRNLDYLTHTKEDTSHD